jgi:hypothetical protein
VIFMIQSHERSRLLIPHLPFHNAKQKPQRLQPLHLAADEREGNTGGKLNLSGGGGHMGRGIPGDDHDRRLEYLSSAFIRHCSVGSGG